MSVKKSLAICAMFLLVGSVFGTALGTGMSDEEGDSSLADGNVAEEDSIEIHDWYDLDEVRDDLSADYVLMDDLDEDTDGYEQIASNEANKQDEFDEILGHYGNEAGDQFEVTYTPLDHIIKSEDYYEGFEVEVEIIDADEGIIELKEDIKSRLYIEYKTIEEIAFGWEPIGDYHWSEELEFTGTFDGNGFEIKDLYIYRPDTDYVGLFGATGNGGEITDVGLVDANVTGELNVGGIVGLNYRGTVNNSYAAGNVSGESDIGGLIGYNYGTVSNSHYNINEVSINGAHRITIGALYDEQYQDWISNNRTLDIGDYESTLIPSGEYYKIEDVQGIKDLLGFADNEENNFKLGADIDLSEKPGLYVPYFVADFEGDGYTIKDLHLDWSPRSQVGFFGYLGESASVEDVGIVNSNVSGDRHIGGLIGYNLGTVGDSYTAGNMNGDWGVGGLVGYNTGTVFGSYATGNVSGGRDIGGLIGHNSHTVSNSYAVGNVSGDLYVGGLIGRNSETVSNSYAVGNVSGGRDIGGLIGHNSHTVSNSYATGNVSGESRWVGGLIGYNRGTVSDSYAVGNVSGDLYVGGLIGRNSETVSNSYAAGEVSGEDSIGGLIGSNSGEVEASFYHEDLPKCPTDGYGSLPLNDNEFNSISTFEFAGWDIEMIDTEHDYPFLSWEENDEGATWYIQESENTHDLTIEAEEGGTTHPGPGTYEFYENGKIVVEAHPDEEHYLENWTGDIESENEIIALTMDEDKTITANFEEVDSEITDWEELHNIKYAPQGDYTLENDLDKETTGYDEYVDTDEGWKPIGHHENVFTGTFDGQGNEIRDLHINRSGDSEVGLFWISSGKIENVSLVDAEVRGGSRVGILAGEKYGGTVNDVIVQGNVSGNFRAVGLLIGVSREENTVENSHASGEVKGRRAVGGLVGTNRKGSTISNSSTTGEVSGDDGVGGLVGTNHYEVVVKNSSSAANVSGNNQVGGLTGDNMEGKVYASEATGSVAGEDKAVGGLSGRNKNGIIVNSYATEDVSGNYEVGGLVGRNWKASVENSHAEGDVSGKEELIGGLVGWNDEGIIEDSYSEGNVSGNIRVGALIGGNEGLVHNSHYNIDSVLINGEKHVTLGGLYEEQYEDWIGDKSLEIEDYSDSLVPSEEYYEINDVQGLRDLLGFAGREDLKFRLSDDIDLSEEPGLNIPYLAAEFDGDNHVIYNFTIDQPFRQGIGMFGTLLDGSIRDLKLLNVDVSGGWVVGSLIGEFMGGTVENVSITGEIRGDKAIIGGLVAGGMGEIHNSSVEASVNGRVVVGGLIGWQLTGGVVTSSHFEGDVTGKTVVGGLAGASEGGTVSSSSFEGDVTVEKGATELTNKNDLEAVIEGSEAGEELQEDFEVGNQIGGLVGANLGTVENSYATGNVSGDEMIGGLVGENQEGGEVIDSSAEADVSGEEMIGGLVGMNSDGIVKGSSASGDIECEEMGVGGVVGLNTGEISTSYFDGEVYGFIAGGLVGWNMDKGTVENSYYNIDGVIINGNHEVTVGGIFNDQYQDWIDDKELRIEDYDSLEAVEDHPDIYEISDVQGFRDLLGFVYEDGHRFRLVDDIDLSEEPGLYLPYFEADFDGNGYTISDLTVDQPFASAVGMIGTLQGGAVTNVSIVDVNLTGIQGIAPVAGANLGGTVEHSHATGTVSAERDGGGLVGLNQEGIVSNSSAAVEVSGDIRSAGLVAYNRRARVENSYATGDVEGGNIVGGLVGNNAGIVENSYATGEVCGDEDLGGLIAVDKGGKVFDSFWDTESSGIEYSDGGTGKTTEEMKDVATYTDTDTIGLEEPWDFVGDPYEDEGDEDIWDIDEDEEINDGYPFLSWKEIEHELKLDIEGEGTVTVEWDDGSHEIEDKETFEIEESTIVTLISESDKHWYFENWTGDIPEGEEEEDEITVTMDENKEITALFKEHTYALDVTIEGDGMVDIDPDEDEYEPGTEVTLTAEPEEDWHFVEWTGDVLEGDEEEDMITVTMDEDKEITAHFEEVVEEYDLMIIVEDDESNPIEGATVDIEGMEETTEEDGEAVFKNLEPDTYEYEVIHEDYETKDGEVEIVDQDVTETVTMEEIVMVYNLIFEVEDEDGDPIENATVEVNGREEGTDENGEVVFEDVEPDTYEYEVTHDDYETEGGEIEIVDQDENVTVTMEEDEEDDDIPGFTSLMLMFGVLIAVAIYQKKKE